jgi:glycosyltransferase involved in cell wall biosynthesis
MRAAYVTTYDPADRRAWSGLGYHISRCLELVGIAVERIGPLERRPSARTRARRLAGGLRGLSYPLDRDPDVAQAYSEQVAGLVDSAGCDLVFSPGTLPVAHLRPGRPVAIWADATFASLLRSYPDVGRFAQRTVRQGMDLDRRALARASVAFYASDWAAQSAIDDHGADPDRVEVVPFGANLRIDHDRETVEELVRSRSTATWRLLFVGVDWERKGGDRAVEVARLLNLRGRPTELHVVGSEPKRDLPPFVHVHGFVDSSTGAGADALRGLYRQSHVLVHPARAECFGVVFCEAAAHGVLSAASRVGGIPSAVRDGLTGTLFDVDAPAADYADHVERLLGDRPRYEEAALAAFDEYLRSLSWEAGSKRIGARLGRLA